MKKILLFVLIGLYVSVYAQDGYECTGKAEIPNSGGKKVKYITSATKVGKKKARMWLSLTNENPEDISFIVCNMFNIKDFGQIEHDFWSIEKVPDGDGGMKWKCTDVAEPAPTPDEPDADKWLPSYHFGCERVTIPANSSIIVHDKIGCFTLPPNVPDFDKDDLNPPYIDFLRDCPIDVESCADIKEKANIFLCPALPPDGDFNGNWINIWAEKESYETDGTTTFTWENGNWVTMGNHISPYPVKMIGTVEDAVAGTQLSFYIDGSPLGTYTVSSDGTMCGGSPTIIEEFYTIPLMPSLFSLEIQLPNNNCGINIPESTVVRFHGDVFAEPGSPIYNVGDFMYSIDAIAVKDSVPPSIVNYNVFAQTGNLQVEISATDENAIVMGANFIYSYSGVTDTLILDFTSPPFNNGEFSFEASIPSLPLETQIDYYFEIFDEFCHITTTPMDNIIIPDSEGCCKICSSEGVIIECNSPVLLSNCDVLGGYEFIENGVCDTVECECLIPVPTLSQWGLIILALLTLIIGIVSIKQSQIELAKNGERMS